MVLWRQTMLKALILAFAIVGARGTSIVSCHSHDASYFCINTAGEEGVVSPVPTATAPSSYTSCHNHGRSTYCLNGDEEVMFSVVSEELGTTTISSTSTQSHALISISSEDNHEHSSTATSSEDYDHDHSSTVDDHDHDHSTTIQDAAITGCHSHGSAVYCIDLEGNEGSVSPAPSGSSIPLSYTGCHAHGSETYCLDASGSEIYFAVENAASVTAQATGVTLTSIVSGQTTAVTDCHSHGSMIYCVDGNGAEGYISPAPTEVLSSYTDCSALASATICVGSLGLTVQFVVESAATSSSSSSSAGLDCHFHAGVEHCVSSNGAEVESCDRVEREYNINLRVGLLFAILGGSLVAVFTPLLVQKVFQTTFDGVLVIILKQMGTGIIISTALVHLLTHSFLMFSNSCITLKYESTASAVTMAGLFVAFLVEIICKKILLSRDSSALSSTDAENDLKDASSSEVSNSSKEDKIRVILLEVGIIFHSVLIGITLVVTADSYLITLFIVILFHQGFEGIALGTRIAELTTLSLWIKIIMAAGFAVTTPLGMSIGIGVLNSFNGNNKSTVIALGTLDAFSAGILLWVSLIEMLAHDWLHGQLANASAIKMAAGLLGLIAGMVLMSVLGKWA